MTLKQELEKFSVTGTEKKNVIVLGDSFSWGGGLAEFTEKTIPYEYLQHENYDNWPYQHKHNYGGLIAKDLGFNYINYSVPGCSNDTIYRNFMHLLEYHRDWLDNGIILIGWTANHRYEISSPDLIRKYRNMAPTWERKLYSFNKWVCEYHELYNKHILNTQADDLRSYNHIVSVSAILELYNIKNMQFWAINQFQEDFEIQKRLQSKFKNFCFDINLSAMCHYDIKPADILPCRHPNENGHRIIANRILSVNRPHL